MGYRRVHVLKRDRHCRRRSAASLPGVVLFAGIAVLAPACQEVNHGPFLARTQDGVVGGVFPGCDRQHTFNKLIVWSAVSVGEYVEVATIEVKPGAGAVSWFPLAEASTVDFVVSDPAGLRDALQEGRSISLVVETEAGKRIGGSLRYRPPTKVGQAYLTERNVPLARVSCP